MSFFSRSRFFHSVVPTALVALGFFVAATPALADDSSSYGFVNPLGVTSVPQVIGRVVYWVGGLGGSLFFLYLLWGGIQWMLAGGDSKKVADAQGKIKAAAAGIIVILFAYMAVAAIIGVIPH